MQTNDYFETLNFNSGKKINVSRKIDNKYSDMMHWHPFVEILLSLKDSNEVSINFTKHIMKINDVVIIYPGDLHSVHASNDESFLLVQFPLDLLTIMSDLNNIFSVFCQYPHIKYDPASTDNSQMVLYIKELADLYYADTPYSEVQIYSLLLRFFAKLAEYCVNAKKEDFSNETNPEYRSTKLMAEACLYISQNCTKPLTLDDISHHIGVSKSHFAYLFKRYTNMTFIDFLTKERIKRAENLISNPNEYIINIAFDSGFSSISSFNRAFKKIKGISPSEFRETMIN